VWFQARAIFSALCLQNSQCCELLLLLGLDGMSVKQVGMLGMQMLSMSQVFVQKSKKRLIIFNILFQSIFATLELVIHGRTAL